MMELWIVLAVVVTILVTLVVVAVVFCGLNLVKLHAVRLKELSTLDQLQKRVDKLKHLMEEDLYE